MHEQTFHKNSKFEVFDHNKTSDVHGLLNETKIVHQSYGLLCQLKLCHVFQDQVAIYMDLEFSKGFRLLEFEIKVDYALQINFLL